MASSVKSRVEMIRGASPLRGELLGSDRLAEEARRIARRQVWAPGKPGRPALLAETTAMARRQLTTAYRTLAADAREDIPVPPAAEWLLDNFYLIEEQITLIEDDLPAGYGAKLPYLVEGPFEQLPRVLETMVALVTHTDSRVDSEHLDLFVESFQEVSPLTIGEVWAVPIMLRVALVENLRRLSLRVLGSHQSTVAADRLADRLLEAMPLGPDEMSARLADLDRAHASAPDSFLVRLSQRLAGQDEALAPLAEWLDARLAEREGGLEHLAIVAHQSQAADQVSVANAITSIRFLDALGWREFFERASLVERTLREDPLGVYARMDFESRDRYRHAVERLALRSPLDEIGIARAAVDHAIASLERDASDDVGGHVGYYLISGGRYAFEADVRYRPRPREILYRGPLAARELIFWGLMALLVVAFETTVVLFALPRAPVGAVVLLVALGAIPLSDVALSVVNRIAAAVWPARTLPKIDYRQPVAGAHSTIVVYTALLTSSQGVRHVIDNMEVGYLANLDPNVRFAVLGDLKAADAQHATGDDAILREARDAIARLNQRYGRPGSTPFGLFVRGRTWTSTDSAWMGWERKRGAISEFCRLARGATDTSFTVAEGDRAFLARATFLITLDTDTVLPRDGASKLISAIAHPLNRAKFDSDTRMVTRGYGLVQPRVSMSLGSSASSRFSWLYSGVTGIDPYAGAVSDTYQDVFGEGSFTGKGIFEIDVFNAALDARFPDNALLSHDLLEGSYLRTGLASDIEVLDDQPSSYISHCARLHRWVRGDWQTLPWLLPRVPLREGTERNPLRALHRWKIADNLRRSLSPLFTVLFAIAGFAVLRGGGGLWWLALMAALLLFPLYFGLSDSLLFRRPEAGTRGDHTAFIADLKRDALRSLFDIAVLPHQAQLRTDAAVRALWRMTVTRRRLLEWETAAESEHLYGTTGLSAFVFHMWPATLGTLALAVPVAFGAGGLTSLAAAAPLLALWAVAPGIAWLASRPARRPDPGFTADDVVAIRRVARKTWRFFETFVTAEDHYLAPDNFQEDPKGEVAHRTSPTNMGLQLLACATAYDLGYLEVSGLIDRVSRTLHTLAGMERFRGHFYNWYDTTTLEPLRPTYVSTVDSGNLAGHLLVLRVAMLEAAGRPLLGPQLLDGIEDTTRLALEELQHAHSAHSAAPELAALHSALEDVVRRLQLDTPPANLGEWLASLESLAALTADLPELVVAARTATGEPVLPDESVTGITDVWTAVHTSLELITTYVPWAEDIFSAVGSHEGTPDPALEPLLAGVPSLLDLAEGLVPAVEVLDAMAAAGGEDAAWASNIAKGVRAARPDAERLLAELRLAVDISSEMWEHTDFAMLFDESRLLFSIGFNTAEGRLDDSFYDMLASECRLASFLAIAKDDVPQEHWFRLARTITRTDGGAALVSWSASMFEYLMPLIVMRAWPDTLLGRTYETVVRRQIQYGNQRGVPWGVSESAFNAKDADLTYQYQAFGVPGLGLKRGLSADMVVAPYATVLALMVAPRAALENLSALSRQGAEGRFGYYEAVDYTPGRVPAGKRRAVVRAYMAHHQGMSFIALGNVLTDLRMQHRFHSDPLVASAELLLQERVPRRIQLAQPRVEEVEFVRSIREVPPPVTRAYPLANTPVPATHFLSNGSYSVMVTNGGGGYSRWGDRSVTRYREDLTRDCWGSFVYLRDLESKHVWSATFQPTLAEPDDYHVTFSADKAEFRRSDDGIDVHTEIVVSPEDDVEVRRITITNRRQDAAVLDITSYLEVTLALRGGDHAHKAYSNLFVETEAIDDYRALLFTRRPRSAEEPRPWGLHLIACDSRDACSWSYETDRAAFLGRLRTPYDAVAVREWKPLTGSTGAVLDPICAVRQPLTIPAEGTAHLAFITGAAESRERVLALAEKYHDIGNAQRAADLAWSTSQIELRDLGITPEEAVTFQRLASRLLLTDPYSRLKVITKVENRLPISSLWQLGISGDEPILLLKIDRLEEAPLVRQALLAHQYWRSKGFVSDLVILNTKPSAYASELDGRLRMLMRTGHALQLADKPGGVHLRSADHIQPDVLNLLESVARVVIAGDGGPIALQLDLRGGHQDLPEQLMPLREEPSYASPASERPALAFDNGFGGFDLKRDEYVIIIQNGEATPAPWANVIANPRFGTMISEAGIGCTWAENSHENRITTWNNDPVSDGTGECLYVRDEDTGAFWSPTPLPVFSSGNYTIRHGRGYSTFEHTAHGIAHTLDWFVAAQAPARIARIRLTNRTSRPRRLSVTHFVEWALGPSRSEAQQRVVTWWDDSATCLMAHNWFNLDFPGRPAFLACDQEVDSYTASRTEFIGRNGTPVAPAAMYRRGLSGQSGRFHDNCGALMRLVELAPDETAEISFFLGQTASIEEAHAILARLREPGAVQDELDAVRDSWRTLLDTIRVETPDPELDIVLNGPALYQSVSCRFWGRTATYQSSGAFGFRDQLQDCLALLAVRPGLARNHIIEAARRQFPEGDVLHWWQPISGRGVRTRYMDDRHWLPLVVAEYVQATGDLSVLDVETPYLESVPLPDDREDLYLEPHTSLQVASVYRHCLDALHLSPTGPQGLPLIGGGDWNDGMNRVGIGGTGESVWLAWFLDVVMRAFADVCAAVGDEAEALWLREKAASLVSAVEASAWDGSWYRRAFFDDGTPLGTARATECRIDAIAQAWSVISGQGDSDRARRAMQSVEEQLVRWNDGLVLLLAPPFDHMPQDPGYIKGYVPGVRENGGQYTHAALWVALAYALIGDADEAVSLLDLVNPVVHAKDRAAAELYKVEPYSIAADVYAIAPHTGRGGWTWYTGSAGWFYRVAIRDVLGLKTIARDGQRYLQIDPCIPKTWPSFKMTYRLGDTAYEISVSNPRSVNRGVAYVTLDGTRLADPLVPLASDGETHSVEVAMLGG